MKAADRPILSELQGYAGERQMERAGAAMLLPSGHPIHSFINDGMDLCVWLQNPPSSSGWVNKL